MSLPGRVGILATLALSIFSTPLVADAQQPGKVPRIGYLGPGSPSTVGHLVEAFRRGLRVLGYVEGQNIAIEYRWAEGRFERLPDLAAELVRLNVDVIVTATTPAIQAAKQATKTIPIVMAVSADPVETGLVASLARPGGNITGLSLLAPEIVGKQLQLLKEAVPKVSRVAVLCNPANLSSAPQLREAEVAARPLGVRLQILEARSPDEFESAFAAMTRERVGSLLVLGDPLFFQQRTRLADLAAKSRVPAMYGVSEHAEAGGLIAYSANVSDVYRRAATYVDKILKGAKPADLPVEQPTTFELVINLKTARALGLTIPQTVLIRADQVIQ
jgi:putative ABC transport system substrate-binding protein